MCRILILVDIRPMGYKRDVVVFGLGKNLLFKYILGRCEIGCLRSFMIHSRHFENIETDNLFIIPEM